MRLAVPPVEVQVLGQERARDQPRRGCASSPCGSSWRIVGVDDRIAGAALAPGVEQLLVVVPLEPVVRRACGRGACCRVVEQDVGVESRHASWRANAVRRARARAPPARAARCSRNAGRARAPTSRPRAGRGAPRSGRGRRRTSGSPARARRARRAGRARAPPARRGGQAPDGQPARELRARGAPWISRRGSCCHARQNGVKTEYGLTAPRSSAMKSPGCGRASSTSAHPAVARPGERRDVVGEVHGLGAALARQRGQLLLRPALADHRSAPRSRSASRAPRGSRAGTMRGWRTGSARAAAAWSSTNTARRGRTRGARRSAPGGRGRADRAGTRRGP